LDNGIYVGFKIPLEYDPILSKLIAFGENREEAIHRMQRALREYRISGPRTNLYFHQRALQMEDFIRGNYDTHFIDKHLKEILDVPREEKTQALMAAALAKFLEESRTQAPTDAAETGDASPWRISGRRDQMRD
jgi:acetyl-CoA carboxylase biotin carboxylase subunit